MIRIAPSRRVCLDGEENPYFKPHVIGSLTCCQYDSSTANPVNPQGTAGGGNVFFSAPLFGSSSNSGGSYGNNPATTTNKDTAALGGPASSVDASPTPTLGESVTSFFAANKTLILLGLAVIGGFFGLGLIVKLFRTK